MKTAVALLALVVSACGGSAIEAPSTEPPVTGPPIGAPVDTCAVVRPDFGPPASDADRALFDYDATGAINLQKTVQSSSAIFQLSRISYSSPAGGQVTGILSEPVGRSGLRPGIVIMHPSGNPTSPKGVDMEVPNANYLAGRGAVVIAIDAPFVRKGRPYSPLFTTQDRDEQIQLIKDLQRAVDILLARPDVDPARIGFIGYSYGAMIGVQFVGIERRLKAAVLAAPPAGEVTHATTESNLAYMATIPCATRNAWFKTMAPIEPIRFVSNAAPTALLFQIGRFDTAVPLADAAAVALTASSPKDIRYYDTGHGLSIQALDERFVWLQNQIGIDP